MGGLPVRDVVRRVQDIVADATGQRLGGEAEQELVALLGDLDGTDPGVSGRRGQFSHRDVTILLADLRGFMAMTASHPAGAVLELLNRCFGRMSEIIVRHDGVIDKFMGDSIMAIFARGRGRRGEDARRALHCAVDMQIALEALNKENGARAKNKLPPLYLGIGINTGRVLAGLVGSELYSAYTVIGEDVNLTSRIESFSLRGQVLISESTYKHCGSFASTGEPMDVYVKGKSERVRVRELLSLPSLGKTLPRQEIRRSPRVAVTLPFSYRRVQNKIVKPALLRGRILDIGYYGVLAEVEEDLGMRAELNLDLELSLVEHRAADVYARVVKVMPGEGGRNRVGLEFTSLSPETNGKLQLFVQMLIQGHES
jgi:adenylate cyclase